MVKADYAADNKNSKVSNREFVCGLVEVSNNLIKLTIDSEFLVPSESGFTGIISLESGNDAATISKMKGAAEYFAELAQDLRKAALLYQSWKPEAGTPIEVETRPRNQQQQAEHLNKVHAILEQLPEAEKTIYQGFGFGERAQMYKLIGDETDPTKMQATICSLIKDISEKKGGQA